MEMIVFCGELDALLKMFTPLDLTYKPKSHNVHSFCEFAVFVGPYL